MSGGRYSPIAIVLLNFLSSEAHAFDPAQCTVCGSGWAEKNWIYVSDPDQDPFAFATDSSRSRDGMTENGLGQYQDRIDQQRPFVGNRYARGLKLFHRIFMTEPSFDFMELYHVDSYSASLPS